VIVRIELSENDLDTIVRVLSDAADYSGDMVRETDDEDEEHDVFREDSLEFRRLAGYLETAGLLAAAKDFASRIHGPSAN